MMDTGIVKVLLVEDDEDDYIITRDLLSEIPRKRVALQWVKTFDEGLEEMLRNQHDVCLLDYRLGPRNGVELLQTAVERGCQSPIILLTGLGLHEVDLQAMEAGAADYLIKSRLDANSLERTIRYALQRRSATALAAFEQARLAAFGSEVGLALTRRDSLDRILHLCAQAMARYLNASLAQISTFDSQRGVFELRVSAGALCEKQSSPRSLPTVRLDVDQLTAGKTTLIKQLRGDPRVSDREWAGREGMVCFAAHPLVLEERLVGLMSIFTAHPLSEQVGEEMSSVANGIALCIERKHSEEALGVSEDKYRSVVENIKEVIFQLDASGKWTFLNPAWAAITGFEVATVIGTCFWEQIHPEDRERNQQAFRQLIERKLDSCRYETRFLTRDGNICWLEVHAQPMVGQDEKILGVTGSLVNVTDRKLAESQIQKLAAFPRVSPNPVLEFAADGTLTYANEATHELAKTLGQQEIHAILPPSAAATARECLSTGLKKSHEEVTLNGRTIIWSFFPVTQNQVVHCYGDDVTEMLNLEAQFRHAQKLESIGQLAAGVAHDFNNILTVIQGYSDCLLARCDQDEMATSALTQISNASKRAAALTRQLLMFSRKQVIQPTLLELNAVLRSLAKMLPRLLGEDITLQTDDRADLPRIKADAGMIEQVVMNLAVNARDAMPKGGRLSIATAVTDLDATCAARQADSRPGRFICLTVTDSGCGMDRKTLERIFEPFFTTKGIGKGTGLGLATVYGIVKQHQGWVEVTSQIGVGTTFRVYLPIALETANSNTETITAAQPIRGGQETILLVEDEPVVRELARDVLRGYQYQVVEASCGPEALRIWDEHNGQFDLLLTDLVMPEGITGRELAIQLKIRKPDLRVIYSSGYSPEILGKDFRENETAFLPKPYLPPQLAKMVRRRLDAKGAARSEPAQA
jgi:two-component system, cell cycle sensor histidine kinase and response regulator CckA